RFFASPDVSKGKKSKTIKRHDSHFFFLQFRLKALYLLNSRIDQHHSSSQYLLDSIFLSLLLLLFRIFESFLSFYLFLFISIKKIPFFVEFISNELILD
ncbi:hypothetical protein BCR42DRAFT_352843, partial [Absidia repens]